MNNTRRKSLKEVQERLSEIKSDLESMRDDIESLKGEEEEYKENMPDNMQDGDKGSRAQYAIDSLEEAAGHIDDSISSIDNAISG